MTSQAPQAGGHHRRSQLEPAASRSRHHSTGHQGTDRKTKIVAQIRTQTFPLPFLFEKKTHFFEFFKMVFEAARREEAERTRVYTALLGVGYFGQVKEEANEGVSTENYDNFSKFLSRILGIPNDLPNGVFKLFMDTLDVIISEAKKAGRYDRGIMDQGTQLAQVRGGSSSVDGFM